MYLNIILLPLVGSIFSGLFSRILGTKGAYLTAIFCVYLSAVFSIYAFYDVALCGNIYHISLFKWIHSGLIDVSWSFLFDSLTVMMLVVVTLISSIVHTYSVGYMHEDPHKPRFFSYLSIFTFFMLVLVTSDNFVQLFLGWEGVGLSSYLLINFWFTRIQANKAAMKAMIVNKVGDFGLALGIMAIFYLFKAVDFSTVFSLVYYFIGTKLNLFTFNFDFIMLICLFLFVGAVGKSAQIGLHTWLPDAMEGPTPVSALIHAATMVTAGVFLIIRCSPILEYSNEALMVVTFVGAATAFLAATTGVAQNDLKKVIAYSTCSQLGYMVFACGISAYSVAAFHLMNHAFFKALLFLSAGSVIHALSDEQDMRKMGGLAQLLPFTYILMLVASLSLMGIPFLTGFYSKDVILELTFVKVTTFSNFAYWLGTISALFTSFYSFRLLYLTFLTPFNGFRKIVSNAHDAPYIMAVPLFILAIGSIFVGYIFKDMMIGIGTDFWGNSIYINSDNVLVTESEFLPFYIKAIPVVFSIIGALIALFINYLLNIQLNDFVTSGIGSSLYTYLNRKWLFDNFYNEYIVRPLLTLGYQVTFKILDRGFVEIIGPNGLARVVKTLSILVSKVHSGFIYHYTFIFFLGLTLSLILIKVNMLNSIDFRLIGIWFTTVIIIATKKLMNF